MSSKVRGTASAILRIVRDSDTPPREILQPTPLRWNRPQALVGPAALEMAGGPAGDAPPREDGSVVDERSDAPGRRPAAFHRATGAARRRDAGLLRRTA